MVEDCGQGQMPGEGDEDLQKLSVIVARIRVRQGGPIISRQQWQPRAGVLARDFNPTTCELENLVGKFQANQSYTHTHTLGLILNPVLNLHFSEYTDYSKNDLYTSDI